MMTSFPQGKSTNFCQHMLPPTPPDQVLIARTSSNAQPCEAVPSGQALLRLPSVRLARAGFLFLLGLQGTLAAVHAADATSDDDARLVRMAEYEGLLAQPLSLATSLCMDDQLRDRWPRGADPSPPQWQAMLDQAARAHERCASADDGTARAAKTIRRAMALQVERQKAFEERRSRLRACAAAGGPSASAQACERRETDGPVTHVQWARIVRAMLLGEQ